MVSVIEALLIFILIVILSLIVASLYRRIVGGIVTRREEREVQRIGKRGIAKEKIEIKR